jgi:hypothetical protein
MKRSAPICVFILGIGFPIICFAIPSIGTPTVSPRVVPLGPATAVTITAQITDTSYIAGSANVQQLDVTGKVVSVLGLLHDDGIGGDQVAGDKTFTTVVSVGGSSPATVRVRVSAALRGLLTRVFSPVAAIAVSTPRATNDGTHVVFQTETGETVAELQLLNESNTSSTPDGDVTVASYQEAVLSNDATHVGIYSTTTQTAPGGQEGSGSARFQYFNAFKQLWQITTPFEYDFVPPPPYTRTMTDDGSRVLLVQAAIAGDNPTLLVYDQGGALVYQTPPQSLTEVYSAQLSLTGRYLAVTGFAASGNRGTDIVRVTDTDVGTSWEITYDAGMSSVAIHHTADGRFSVDLDGSTTLLPPSP